mgnify:CR=1 FL=1
MIWSACTDLLGLSKDYEQDENEDYDKGYKEEEEEEEGEEGEAKPLDECEAFDAFVSAEGWGHDAKTKRMKEKKLRLLAGKRRIEKYKAFKVGGVVALSSS